MNTELIAKATDAFNMFIYLAVELTLLFLVVSFIIGVIMDFVPNHKIQSILGSRKGKGYISAGLLGALTPFCSCSTIPMLSGLLKARAGFGPTITFLFTSPLMNPIIIGLFLATFGVKVTVIYFIIALTVSVLGGFILEKLGFERYIRQDETSPGCGSTQTSTSCDSGCTPEDKGHWSRIWTETWKQFKKLFPILMLGVAIGSLTYGFVPANFIAKYAGPDNVLAIPFAAVIGVPLYIRAEAVIPLVSALGAKGMGLGAQMALIIGSAGASLTEVILLRSLFRIPMIIAFLVVIFTMAISAGLIFTLVG